jgi:hypothetical protein
MPRRSKYSWFREWNNMPFVRIKSDKKYERDSFFSLFKGEVRSWTNPGGAFTWPLKSIGIRQKRPKLDKGDE